MNWNGLSSVYETYVKTLRYSKVCGIIFSPEICLSTTRPPLPTSDHTPSRPPILLSGFLAT